jgi:hypothetical protein
MDSTTKTQPTVTEHVAYILGEPYTHHPEIVHPDIVLEQENVRVILKPGQYYVQDIFIPPSSQVEICPQKAMPKLTRAPRKDPISVRPLLPEQVKMPKLKPAPGIDIAALQRPADLCSMPKMTPAPRT